MKFLFRGARVLLFLTFIVYGTGLWAKQPTAEIPLEEYRNILQKLEQEETPESPDRPPIPYLLTESEISLTPRGNHLIVEGTLTVRQLRESYSFVPLARSSLRLQRVTVDGSPASVHLSGEGIQRLVLKSPGTYTVRYRGVVPVQAPSAQEQVSRLDVPVASASRYRLKKIHVRNADYSRTSLDDTWDRIRVNWDVSGSGKQENTIQQTTQREQTLSVDQYQSVRITENFVSGIVRYELQFRNPGDSPVVLRHPAHVRILRPRLDDQSDGVERKEQSDTQTALSVETTWPEQAILRVRYEYRTPDSGPLVTVPRIVPQQATTYSVKIGVAGENVRLYPDTLRRAYRVDPSAFDRDNFFEHPPFSFGFRSIHKDYRIQLKRSVIDPVSVLPGYVHEGTVRLIRTKAGNGFVQARYTIRGTGIDDLRVSIPKNARLFSTFLDGKPVKAGEVDSGTIRVFMQGNDSKTPASNKRELEVWLGLPKDDLGWTEFRTETLPRVHLTTRKIKVELMYPEHLYPMAFFGHWDQLPLPRPTGQLYRYIYQWGTFLLYVTYVIMKYLLYLAVVVGLIVAVLAGLYYGGRWLLRFLKNNLTWKTVLAFLGAFVVFMLGIIVFALGPQIRGMFENTVDRHSVGEGQSALSASIYGSDRQESTRQSRRSRTRSKKETMQSEPEPTASSDDAVAETPKSVRREQFLDRNLKRGVLPVKFKLPSEGIVYSGADYYPDRSSDRVHVFYLTTWGVRGIYLIVFLLGIVPGYFWGKGTEINTLVYGGTVLVGLLILAGSYWFFGLIINYLIGIVVGKFSYQQVESQLLEPDTGS
ncbi:MAG: hypothetical protein ABEJ65_12645 [bacterium]